MHSFVQQILIFCFTLLAWPTITMLDKTQGQHVLTPAPRPPKNVIYSFTHTHAHTHTHTHTLPTGQILHVPPSFYFQLNHIWTIARRFLTWGPCFACKQTETRIRQCQQKVKKCLFLLCRRFNSPKLCFVFNSPRLCSCSGGIITAKKKKKPQHTPWSCEAILRGAFVWSPSA